MQLHRGLSKTGDVLSINILKGEIQQHTLQMLLTQGIEVEIGRLCDDAVTLIIRAPQGMLIVEELAPSNHS